MHKFYTSNYEGEMVSDSLHWRDGFRDSHGVWIPKTIVNEEHTGVAHIIGNGPSRLKINLDLLHGQYGGEGGVTDVGQSYGCNQIFEDFNPTFLFCVNPEILDNIAKSEYCDNNIVYTTRKNILKFPGKFHLYPHWHSLFMGPAALRLACADGHKKIYMIGFDFYLQGDDQHIYPATDRSYIPIIDPTNLQQKLVKQVVSIVNQYKEIEFYHVLDTFNTKVKACFDEFRWLENLETIGMGQYINKTCLGAIAK